MSGRYGILGGGAFGRGIASASARIGNDVVLVSRTLADDAVPGVRIARDASALARVDLVFVCVPSRAIEAAADELAEHLDGHARLVHVSRGLAGESLVPLSSVLRDRTACRRVGVLAGPLVAGALANGSPGGAIVGSRFPEVSGAVRDAIAGESLRVFDTDDVVGVEVASACVGVLSLALGCGGALGVGPSALATIATRGVAEAARLGDAFGASRVTFGGLAGMGDLIAVVAGDERPEYRIGEMLAKGSRLADAVAAVGENVESVTLVSRLLAFARRSNVDTPILEAISHVLDGSVEPARSLIALMGRRGRREAS